MEARYIEKDGVKYYAVGHSESTVHVPGEGPATTVSEILKHVPTFEDTSIVLEGGQPAINPDILQGINEAKNLANGVIAESGSNNDGSFIKFDDGTLICRIGKRTLNTLGYSNTANDTLRSTWEFPEQFTEAPQVFVQFESVISGAFVNRISTTMVNQSNETSALLSCILVTGHTFTTDSRVVVSAFAIGRWK